MSVFSGPQFKGAMRAHRERKRAEAQARQEQYDARGGWAGLAAEVSRVAREQNVSEALALPVVYATRRMERRKAARWSA